MSNETSEQSSVGVKPADSITEQTALAFIAAQFAGLNIERDFAVRDARVSYDSDGTVHLFAYVDDGGYTTCGGLGKSIAEAFANFKATTRPRRELAVEKRIQAEKLLVEAAILERATQSADKEVAA